MNNQTNLISVTKYLISRRFAAVFVATLLGLGSTTANANLVLNGDFSEGLRWWTVQGGAPANGGAVFGGNGVTFTVPSYTFLEIDQQVQTDLDTGYQVSFNYSGSADELDVRWNEVSVWNSTFTLQAPTAVSFIVAPAGRSPSTLSFFVIGEANGVSIGNIDVTAIPEPTSIALVVLALGCLGSVKRRRCH